MIAVAVVVIMVMNKKISMKINHIERNELLKIATMCTPFEMHDILFTDDRERREPFINFI